MKNLYEILEVDKNASEEIIKVAHKSLVKKYHPDLKEGTAKAEAEEKIKEINDAYDILSNSTKRAEYDQTIENQNLSAEQIKSILKENTRLKMELNYLKNSFYTNSERTYSNTSTNNNYSNTSAQNNNSTEKYENNYANNNNNINKFKSFIYGLDNNIKNVLAFLLTFLIIFIVVKVPFLKNFFIYLFNQGLFMIVLVVLAFFFIFKNKK